jgi:hypothetical protein
MADIREVSVSEDEYDRAYADYLTYWKHSRNVERALYSLLRTRSMLKSMLTQASDALHVRPYTDEELEKDLQAKPKTREEFIEWYNERSIKQANNVEDNN